MSGKITFQRGKDFHYLLAKNSGMNQYVPGPITIRDEKDFFIMMQVKNFAKEQSDIAENVRISFEIVQDGENSVVVNGSILCDNADPREFKSNIRFTSKEPFSMEYIEESAFLYSQRYGLDADHAIQIGNEIMTPEGTLLGYRIVDGLIPGGADNLVTVSIRVMVIRKSARV